MTKRCMYCGEHSSQPAKIGLRLQRGDVQIHIEGIPAHKCTNCGGEAIRGPLAEQISEGAELITRAIEAATATPVPAAGGSRSDLADPI